MLGPGHGHRPRTGHVKRLYTIPEGGGTGSRVTGKELHYSVHDLSTSPLGSVQPIRPEQAS